jgi:hypothetical protein
VAIIDNDYVDCTLFDIFDEVITEDISMRKEAAAAEEAAAAGIAVPSSDSDNNGNGNGSGSGSGKGGLAASNHSSGNWF